VTDTELKLEIARRICYGCRDKLPFHGEMHLREDGLHEECRAADHALADWVVALMREERANGHAEAVGECRAEADTLVHSAAVEAAEGMRGQAAKHYPVAFGEDGLDNWNCSCGARFPHGLDWSAHIHNLPLPVHLSDFVARQRLEEAKWWRGWFDGDGMVVLIDEEDAKAINERLAELSARSGGKGPQSNG